VDWSNFSQERARLREAVVERAPNVVNVFVGPGTAP
jgi:hypothetical protein